MFIDINPSIPRKLHLQHPISPLPPTKSTEAASAPNLPLPPTKSTEATSDEAASAWQTVCCSVKSHRASIGVP